MRNAPRQPPTRPGAAALLLLVATLSACARQENSKPLTTPLSSTPQKPNLSGRPVNPISQNYNVGQITFLDDVVSNAQAAPEIVDLAFQDFDGRDHFVKDYIQDRNLVLVILRGHTKPVCLHCTTQTARLIKHYPELQQRNAEVLVIYPVENVKERGAWLEFLKVARGLLENPEQQVPFPVLFDTNLKAVERLGIKRDLSKPATFIIDRHGKVRFAYIGAHLADRPSVEAVLKELDRIQASTDESASATASVSPR